MDMATAGRGRQCCEESVVASALSGHAAARPWDAPMSRRVRCVERGVVLAAWQTVAGLAMSRKNF